MTKRRPLFTITLVFLFASTLATFAAVPTAQAVNSGESTTNTASTISVSPNPASVGKPVLIQMQIYPFPPQAPEGDPNHYWHDLTLKITKPGGNFETKEGLLSDNAGKLNLTYYPSVAGNHKLELFFPQQTLTFVNLGIPMYITYSIVYRQSNCTTQLIVLSPELDTNPAIPEFTIKFVDNSYRIPSTTTIVSTTDPYTNKTTTTTLTDYGGYFVNQSMEVKIKNQPFTLTFNGSNLTIYYNLRYKPHFGNWAEQYNETTRMGFLKPKSNSEYTIISIPGDYTAHAGGQIDYQVEALSAYNFTSYEYLEHLPSTYTGPYPVPINHTVYVGSSGWSSTQTITIPESSPSISSSPSSTPSSSAFPTPSRSISPSLSSSPSQTQPIIQEVVPLWIYATTVMALIIGVLLGIAIMLRRKIKKQK